VGQRAASVVELSTPMYYIVRPMANNAECVAAWGTLVPYADCVKSFDDLASRLLQYIDEANDRTLIVVLKMRKTVNTL